MDDSYLIVKDNSAISLTQFQYNLFYIKISHYFLTKEECGIHDLQESLVIVLLKDL